MTPYVSLFLFLSYSVVIYGQEIQRLSGSKLIYQNDFESVETGKIPGDFFVLYGEFSTQRIEGNNVLQLPGKPLHTYNLLFGPNERDGMTLQARIKGRSSGRRMPRFGIGLNGISGFLLRVVPARREIELLKNNEIQAAEKFDWKSSEWTFLKLQVRKIKNRGWEIAGKVWLPGTVEPESWMLRMAEENKPVKGRPSLWGTPYSGADIFFDDLSLLRSGN